MLETQRQRWRAARETRERRKRLDLCRAAIRDQHHRVHLGFFSLPDTVPPAQWNYVIFLRERSKNRSGQTPARGKGKRKSKL